MPEIKMSRAQAEMFAQKGKIVVVTKGRRLGATFGAAFFCLIEASKGKKILWGDTVVANIDRYVSRYFKDASKMSSLKYSYRKQSKEMKVGPGVIDFRSADRPENWEGFGYDIIFLNEAGIILKKEGLFSESVLPMLMDHPDSQLIAAGVPKGTKNSKGEEHVFYSLFKRAKAQEKGYKLLRFSSYDNPFIERETIEQLELEIKALSPTLADQEIYGKFVDAATFSLWNSDIIEASRKKAPDRFDEVVVSIDPAVTSKKTSDKTGLIVAGRMDGEAYILADYSGRYSPHQMAQKADQLAEEFGADTIVAEVNNGGDFVKHALQNQNPALYVQEVRATKGKIIRAEPVAALYEAGKVFHCGYFNDLEAQMLFFDGNSKASPDNLDALVWAVHHLILNNEKGIVL